MRFFEITNETVASDREYRDEANAVYDKVIAFVNNHTPTKKKTLFVKMDKIYPKFAPLVIAITAEGQQSSLGAVAASFGIYSDRRVPVIVMDVPSLTDENIEFELMRARNTFVHEFQHYIDHTRSGGKIAPSVSGGLTGYYNNPAEINAHYQEGLAKLFSMMSKENFRKLMANDKERFEWAKQNAFDKNFLAHLSPENMKKFNRRLAREIMD